jgi:chemotaxis signal transduction protein
MASWQGLVFTHGAGRFAIAADRIVRIAHAPCLAILPGSPTFLSGQFLFAGEAVPVIRLDRLLDLEERQLGFYAPLIILKTQPKIAIHVETVERLLRLPKERTTPVPAGNSFNGCAEAQLEIGDHCVTVLSVENLLLRRERETLAAHVARARTRLLALSADAVHVD